METLAGNLKYLARYAELYRDNEDVRAVCITLKLVG